MNHKEVRNKQLGMNYSTASNRLVKDILFNFVVTTGQNKCFQCGEPMERNNFSVEHKVPWLHSANPQETFFDLNNIAFSHLKCNTTQARRPQDPCGTNAKYARGCRCELCVEARAASARKYYNPDVRKAKYKRTGQ